jgi:hypothetical protein
MVKGDGTLLETKNFLSVFLEPTKKIVFFSVHVLEFSCQCRADKEMTVPTGKRTDKEIIFPCRSCSVGEPTKKSFSYFSVGICYFLCRFRPDRKFLVSHRISYTAF